MTGTVVQNVKTELLNMVGGGVLLPNISLI